MASRDKSAEELFNSLQEHIASDERFWRDEESHAVPNRFLDANKFRAN